MSAIEEMYKTYGVELNEFTAEKQLELIKLITSTTNRNYFKICYGFNSKNWLIEADFENKKDKDFAQALAKLVIALKDELDNEKVKEILK